MGMGTVLTTDQKTSQQALSLGMMQLEFLRAQVYDHAFIFALAAIISVTISRMQI